ncbi:CDP-alcohol phosphatidyltransferase family protein [candidate division KSB1 bacterium]|nr:CDP-alcohol phosphatidyltransferase family protein [candidate division KSB1 bacterium]
MNPEADRPLQRSPLPMGRQATKHARRILTSPNVLSVGRLLLLIPLFMFLRRGREGDGNFWAMVIMGIALLSDMLDGLIARVFRQESEWGRVLDPLADKIWLDSLALFLALPWRENPLPWAFLALMIARDGVIVVGAFYIYRQTAEVVKSNMFGKVAMVAEAVTLISYTVDWESTTVTWLRPELFMWITICLMFLSSFSYAAKFRAALAATPR